MSDLPALPDPSELPIENVLEIAAEIERWAANEDAIDELDRVRRFVAEAETIYRRRHERVSADVARADRRLELRIGMLLGPTRRGPQEFSIAIENSLSKDERHQFRLIAEQSDDPSVAEAIERGASRSEVLRLAKRAKSAVITDISEWPEEDQVLRKRMEAGETVVVNMRRHQTLIGWARAVDRYIRIDRATPWGNPFVMPDDGDRHTVIENYEQHYLPHKPSLHAAATELTGGKALGCWCAPEACHGDVLAKAVNAC